MVHDPTDSSFIKLGELPLKNDHREEPISCSSLEDITDQDWDYYCGTYLPSDLDRGFLSGSDNIYFDNVGDKVRIKNGANWRAAIVAMQDAGAAQFKFYIEQPAKCKLRLTIPTLQMQP